MRISISQLLQKILHIGCFQNLAHGNHFFIGHNGRHGHHAVSHDLLHVGDILHFYRQAPCLDSGLGVLILLMTGFAAGPQNFDAADTVYGFSAAAGR